MKQDEKIIFIVNCVESILLFRIDLLRELKKLGYCVTVFAPSYDATTVDTLTSDGIGFSVIKMKRTGMNPIYEFITFIDLYRLFRKEKPYIVLSYTLKPILYASITAYIVRVPIITSALTGFGSIFLGTELKTKIIRFFLGQLFNLALKCNTKIFALNPDIINFFIQNSSLSLNQAVLINGEGLNIDYYGVVPLPDTEYPVFLIITRLIRDKGIYEYVAAAKLIKAKYPKTRFLIVGGLDTNPTALSKDGLKQLLSEGMVEYLGQLADVRTVIEQASVYVLPSYGEGIPRSTLEAMAMGRPIITTDVPGCRETVIDGGNGYLVPVKNVERLVVAMERFISQPALISQMGKESRRIAEEKYDVRKVNQVILKALGVI